MIVNLIAIALAAFIVYRAVDEVMDPLSRSGATDADMLATLGRFLRVMGGTALMTVALVAAYLRGSA